MFAPFFLPMLRIITLTLAILMFSLHMFGQQTVWRSGDMLFVGLPVDYGAENDDMAGAITAVTGSSKRAVNYFHVAILEVDDMGNPWIIDATPKRGVDRHPLDTFLADFRLEDGSLPQIDIMRLKHNRHGAEYVQNALQYCGAPYDVYFLPNNEPRYCSELVRDAYVTRKGRFIFKTHPMNFKAADGTFPPYWENLFQKIGHPIPQGEPGTNPNDMSNDFHLRKIGSVNGV